MIRIINWQFHPAEVSWVGRSEIKDILKTWELAAKDKLKETSSEHVVYGYKHYFTDRDGNETFELNLMLTPLNNEEFYKRTSCFGMDYLVYALHKGTN